MLVAWPGWGVSACRWGNQILLSDSIDAMADRADMQRDNIVVPEWMSEAQVWALAKQKARTQVADDDIVAHVRLHRLRRVGDEESIEVEWLYTYQVILPGGRASDSAP